MLNQSVQFRKHTWKLPVTDGAGKHTNIAEQHDLNESYLSLLVTTQLKVLASLDGQHSLGSTVGLHALKPQDNLLCSLGLKTHIMESDLTHTHKP